MAVLCVLLIIASIVISIMAEVMEDRAKAAKADVDRLTARLALAGDPYALSEVDRATLDAEAKRAEATRLAAIDAARKQASDAMRDRVAAEAARMAWTPAVDPTTGVTGLVPELGQRGVAGRREG